MLGGRAILTNKLQKKCDINLSEKLHKSDRKPEIKSNNRKRLLANRIKRFIYIQEFIRLNLLCEINNPKINNNEIKVSLLFI